MLTANRTAPGSESQDLINEDVKVMASEGDQPTLIVLN